MKKSIVLMLLAQQLNNTKKTTRQDIVAMVSDMVEYHIKENAEINGLNMTRAGTGINLGEMMEIIIRAVFNKSTEKSNINGCDMEYRGKKVEIKFLHYQPASRLQPQLQTHETLHLSQQQPLNQQHWTLCHWCRQLWD